MSLSHLSPFIFLLQAPPSNHAVHQETICLVAHKLPCKRSLSVNVSQSSLLMSFWPLLKLSMLLRSAVLLCKEIKLCCSWPELHFFHCLARFLWIVPCAPSYSYLGTLVPWSCRAFPHVLWISSSLSSYKPGHVQAGPSLLSLLTFSS